MIVGSQTDAGASTIIDNHGRTFDLPLPALPPPPPSLHLSQPPVPDPTFVQTLWTAVATHNQ